MPISVIQRTRAMGFLLSLAWERYLRFASFGRGRLSPSSAAASTSSDGRRRVPGTVRRGRLFAARVVGERQRKSKSAEQPRPVGLRKQGQPGNHVMLEREHLDGVRGPWRVGAGAGIGRECGLPVGCRRYQAIAVIGPPGPREEGADRLTPRIPLRYRRHGVGRILLEQGHETVDIELFPGLQVTAEQLLLCGRRRGCDRWFAIGIVFG